MLKTKHHKFDHMHPMKNLKFFDKEKDYFNFIRINYTLDLILKIKDNVDVNLIREYALNTDKEYKDSFEICERIFNIHKLSSMNYLFNKIDKSISKIICCLKNRVLNVENNYPLKLPKPLYEKIIYNLFNKDKFNAMLIHLKQNSDKNVIPNKDGKFGTPNYLTEDNPETFIQEVHLELKNIYNLSTNDIYTPLKHFCIDQNYTIEMVDILDKIQNCIIDMKNKDNIRISNFKYLYTLIELVGIIHKLYIPVMIDKVENFDDMYTKLISYYPQSTKCTMEARSNKNYLPSVVLNAYYLPKNINKYGFINEAVGPDSDLVEKYLTLEYLHNSFHY